MTNLLEKTLRDEASRQEPPTFDPALIVADGRRRLRRRRATTGLAAAAVLGVVAAGAATLPGLTGGGTPDEKDRDGLVAEQDGGSGRFAERRVGFAVRDVIHWGQDSFTVGAPVSSYVQTDDGFVYTTKDGRVWLYDGAASERIGSSANRRLRSDDTGSLVAWVEQADGGPPQYVVYDTAAREEAARVDSQAAAPTRDPGDEGAEVYAVDDGHVYWRTGEGIGRYDVASGRTDTVWDRQPVSDPTDRPQQVTLLDVANGTIAYVSEGQRGSQILVGTSIGADARETPAEFGNGVLSPEGTYLAVEEADELAVYETATGTALPDVASKYPFKVVYDWVDDDTAMVFALRSLQGSSYVADMMACDVATNACQITEQDLEVSLGTFTLPVGDPMDT